MTEHKHEPTTFWFPCFLCEKATHERELTEARDARARTTRVTAGHVDNARQETT